MHFPGFRSIATQTPTLKKKKGQTSDPCGAHPHTMGGFASSENPGLGPTVPQPGPFPFSADAPGPRSAIAPDMPQRGTRRLFGLSPGCVSLLRDPHATVFFDLRTPEEKVRLALKMLLGNVALSDLSFVLGVTEATVLAWRRRAAQKAHAIHGHWLRALPVTQGPLAEMGRFLRRTQAKQADPDGARPALREDGGGGGGSVLPQHAVFGLAALCRPTDV